jgi:hypothetical protein
MTLRYAHLSTVTRLAAIRLLDGEQTGTTNRNQRRELARVARKEPNMWFPGKKKGRQGLETPDPRD